MVQIYCKRCDIIPVFLYWASRLAYTHKLTESFFFQVYISRRHILC